ncbi:MAG: hypothetical protein NTZ56_07210 [Acidobacteria bacterium]|nr:hypothetical protein [Acidobacteriota bacterium]
MPSSIRQITGNWDLGFVLSKHSISSIPSGTTSTGRTLFDTKRTEIGEALYRLKYQSDWTRVPVLAEALASTIYPKFQDVGILIPMPASKARPKQPVTEITKALGALVGIAVFEGLVTKESSRLRKKAGDRLLTRAAQLLRTRICNSLQSHDREGVVLQNPFSAAC